jgi:hypothetical protein
MLRLVFVLSLSLAGPGGDIYSKTKTNRKSKKKSKDVKWTKYRTFCFRGGGLKEGGGSLRMIFGDVILGLG